jgi:hypothetical protein
MQCAECDAFLSEFTAATLRYASLTDRLGAAVSAGTEDSAFQKLLNEVTQARLECQRTKKALQVHRDGCPLRKRPDQLT